MSDHSYHRTVTSPVIEPLHKTEVKNHLRVTGAADDALIESLITVARSWCEMVQGLCYVVRTYKQAYDGGFPTIIYPQWSPVVSAVITYVDSDGDTQTLAETEYTLDQYANPPRIFEAYQKTWPTGLRDIENNVAVTYIAGYAAKITVDAATEIFTVSGRTFDDADIVRVYNSGGSALPTGLSANTDYYVRDVDGYTFKLAATAGGDAIDITAAATVGNNYIMEAGREWPEKFKAAMMLLIGHLYENREATTETALQTIPLGVTHLLFQDRVNW
jgi:uncharacterized phiE125 gp8 family phage protein